MPTALAHIVAADLAGHRQRHEGQLTGLPGVQKLISTIVVRQIAEARPFLT
ncbi:hypothetical protein ACFYR1_48615 [Streptomyces canus]|uniref:hypothetical protein n=1 Tax=Streptomyces canus TaxID=58343 RepID=UPI003690758A